MSKFTFSFDQVLSGLLKRDIKKVSDLFRFSKPRNINWNNTEFYTKAKNWFPLKFSQNHVSRAMLSETSSTKTASARKTWFTGSESVASVALKSHWTKLIQVERCFTTAGGTILFLRPYCWFHSFSMNILKKPQVWQLRKLRFSMDIMHFILD